MATNRRTRSGTATVASKPKNLTTRARRKADASQLLIIGACTLMIGIVAAIGIALGAHNDTHVAVFWLPVIPILAGIGLLFWGLAKIAPKRSRGIDVGDEALEPR